ncbi:MAG: DUF5916 domain-containing protein, partial [Saprospiraceae bacterium]|nr:DUF5916 domain-containing protein [Saprospiraceae bacterium]
LLVGVRCFDRRPDRLVVSDARRDADLEKTDAFLFILDTYHDGQNGFVFGTNPIGIEYDAQVDNEGQGNFNANRQQGGTIGGFNLNWDASWQVATRVDSLGWSAEFAIPLRTLRYNAGDSQTWGINFQRNIRKTNEVVYWSPLPVGFDIKRLSLAGDLTNLSLRSPGNVKIVPYVLGQAQRDDRGDGPATRLTGEAGVDAKISVTSSLTLDLTYNTDFAQVEVDEQQVNLDRFNLFFPEKRPFFLENAGQFTVGSPGEVDLFFSRRIGIGPTGGIVPIIGGARLSGKVRQTNIGVLSMFTDDVAGAGVHKNNFNVARVSHEFAARSRIGGAWISRMDVSGEGPGDNHVFALDGKIGIGNKAQITGYFAKSQSSFDVEKEHSFLIKGEYNWNNWELRLAYTEVGAGFNPEVGFLLRESFRKPEVLALYHLRMNGKLGLLELRPHISYRGYWDTVTGDLETSFLHVDNHWEFESGCEVHTGINFTEEGVIAPFEISQGVLVPAGTYPHQEAQIIFWTNQSKPVYLSTRHVWGGFFGGNRKANTATVGLRVGDRFNSEYSLQHNDIDLPGGDFTTTIFRARLSYSFTPRIYLQALVQHNSVISQWNANVRFGWLQQANTGLFVVYNEVRDDGLVGRRSVTLKYSRLFDLVN